MAEEESKPVAEDPATTAAYNAIRASRPSEPEFLLKLEPNDFVIFKSDNLLNEHVTFDVKITNTSTKRQTYKVKCTSNQIFRVRPPLAYLAPGETITIKFSCVTKTIPDPYRHFFAFYHMPSEDKRNVRFAWTANSKPEGITRMPVKFLKTDGTYYPAPEAKVNTAKAVTVTKLLTSSPVDKK